LGDKQSIAPEYVGFIATGIQNDSRNPSNPRRRIDNIQRTFRAIAMLKPKQTLTPAQAAIMLWKIGPHSREVEGESIRSAEDALGSGPSPLTGP